jgi:phytol kinase
MVYMGTIAAVAVVFLILVLAEYLSRYKGIHSELTRKLVHVLVGIFVAFWPFFLSWRQIQLLSVLFLVGVLVSIKLNIFNSIHAVRRNTIGEVLFAMVIGMLAFICTNQWIFAAAMLHLSIADGLAAVVGLAYGQHNSFRIMGQTKSIAGSLAFFFASLAIMFWYASFSGSNYGLVSALILPIVATFAEIVSGEGADNLVIPLLVALVLTSSLS